MQKVEYLNAYPVLHVHDDTDEKALLALTSKSDVWYYEDEFRFVGLVPGSPTASILQHDPDASYRILTDHNVKRLPEGGLISVIVGCQAPEADIVCVKALIERYNSSVQYPCSRSLRS